MKNEPLMIAFTSYDRCGKDFTADRLIKDLKANGYKVQKLSFAKSLKELCAELLNIDTVILEKMKNDNVPVFLGCELMTTRDFIIKVATSIRSKLSPNTFIESLENYIEEDIDIVVIPDMRFILEAEYIKSKNGIIIKLSSDLESCGKNGNRYEVDKIVPTFNYFNFSKSYKEKEEEYYKMLDYILQEIEKRSNT